MIWDARNGIASNGNTGLNTSKNHVFEASRRAQEVFFQISISYLQNGELQVADPKPTLDASEVILELSRAILGASKRNLGIQKVVFHI